MGVSAPVVIGIDLGATNVRAGVFSAAGELLASEAAEIEAARGPQAGLERIGDLVSSVFRIAISKPGFDTAVLRGIGVGSTGPTDSRGGLILNPGTMPGWVDVPIVDYIERRFGVPACLENDADAAALGEYWQGAALGAERMLMLTLGTGIGFACLIDGVVYRGADGFHPEGGHFIVDPSGPECYCGGRGCLESWCSGTAIAAAARQVMQAWISHAEANGEALPETPLLRIADGDVRRITAHLTADAARLGDPVAQSVIAAAAERLGLGVFSLVMLYQPQMIILGGGVMRSADLFLPAVEAAVRRAGASVPVDGLHIRTAQLGDAAGMYGAAYAVRNRIGLRD